MNPPVPHRRSSVRVGTAEDIMREQLNSGIEAAGEARDQVSAATRGEVRAAVDAALSGLDNGSFRVAEKGAGGWTVNQWLKKAVLLSFRLNDRSEEHTSELQSLMRISYAVFCLKTKNKKERKYKSHSDSTLIIN